MSQIAESRWLTDVELADLVKVSVSKLRSDRFLGRGLPYVKYGRNVLYDLNDVQRAFEGMKIQPRERQG